ncbi:DUF4838 domain-containing protein [Ramlibacter montanisoli]|uniref:DUF4838 domain-containing protein n=1 Tax=Ramlibacter montanisoli TaxID=2732512 RepID=A0A849KFD7_9BURK|nr:DUF4838 domain-containing protein [Ramlibacter montanisoli]NNU43655.1 DUF4838 domain-containing protein [Ramlibacter montanisoli]
MLKILCTLVALWCGTGVALAQVAGSPATDMLTVVQDGRALTPVFLSADAGPVEKDAAADLVKYVELMTGARLPLQVIPSGTRAPTGPAILVGRVALAEDGSLAARLRAAAKKDPLVNADAMVRRRSGDRLYLAGNNDRAHAFAVSQLLQDWGCRWYMPTEFGEVVPEHRTLQVGALDHAYGSPFEIRNYVLGWLADTSGSADFQRRNFSNPSPLPVFGHALGKYTKALVPQGKSLFDVPLAEPATAAEVARQIEAEYAKGVPGISLAIEDGIYRNDSPRDRALQARIFDKYMLALSNTDPMMSLYNSVARTLREKYPASPTRIGGLAYANVTLPPQSVTQIEPNVVMWLAPIDIDPNHGMDDPRSAPRQEYRGMMYRWAELLKGRLAIYDYDQGQLVWRDLPNPSHHVFAQDVRHYRKAGILGVSTESRGATATTFLNLYFRLQLLWNPDADVDAMLAEFYPAFYGPAAVPMREYWEAIFDAWKATLVTEHEHYIAPVIYTPELVERLRASLRAAQRAVAPLKARSGLGRNEALYLQRMQFTELSFALIDDYTAMVRAAASDGDYAKSAALGDKALATRERLTAMNPTFTTYKRFGEKGHSWLPGEVQQMRELAQLTNGPRGTLVARTPLEWSFRRDPYDTGLARGWAYTRAGADGQPSERLRTDTYLQGQGVLLPDGQSFVGYYWYQTELDLTPSQAAGNLHLMFPGLFNECWLYVNGTLVAHRPVREPWWLTDYRFEWDVDLTGKLPPGRP